MEELPIGAEITLKVVESNDKRCNGCFFDELAKDLYDDLCNQFKCCAGERKDGKSVKFIRVEK